MNTNALRKLWLPLMLCIAALPATATQAATETAADAEGLVKADVRGLQSVFVRPDARLDGYDKVLLDPIEVAFSRNWQARDRGMQIPEADRDRIRNELAELLRAEFRKELEAGGRYRLVDAADEGTLRIKAEIRDLYINAPDLQRPGITRNYTRSVGEMTLVAELRDGPTGALIARVIDRAKDPESVWLELTSRVDNIAAARRAAREWTRILREQLDAARGSASAAKD